MCVRSPPPRGERTNEREQRQIRHVDKQGGGGSGIGLIWWKDVVKTGSDLECGLEK